MTPAVSAALTMGTEQCLEVVHSLAIPVVGQKVLVDGPKTALPRDFCGFSALHFPCLCHWTSC